MPQGKVAVRYTGQADIRTISKEQFDGINLKHPDVRFDSSNEWKQEVSQEVADYLMGSDSFALA